MHWSMYAFYNHQLTNFQRILEYATKVLMKYKDKINALKQGLASMSKKIEAQYEDIKNKTTPTLEAMTRDLSMAIKEQKEENTKL